MKLLTTSFAVLITLSTAQAAYTCKASSNGYDFVRTRNTLRIAKKIASATCKDHSRTTNSDCDRTVDCSPGDHYKERFMCETYSNGYVFKRKRFSLEGAKTSVVDVCNGHSRTTNAECRSLLQCRSLYSTPSEVSCTTESNGYTFTLHGWERKVIRSRVVSRCQDHSRTTNSECREFVECTGDLYTPAPDPGYGHGDLPRTYTFRSDALTIAETLISTIESLENFASSDDWNEILLPIKKQAGRLSARVSGRASFERVRNTMIHLEVLMRPVDSFVDENMERDALFNEAKRLLAAKEKVNSVLDFLWNFKGDSNDLY
ncbi:MAG: hypothetical protein NXH75_14400 [Halobacteriovoraceae bacterium]|nr:hypothetical protein [Halobacteriovoraceae bacterium]